MATQNSTQQTVSASYVINSAKGEVKVVVSTKKETEKTIQVKPTYVKTRYSIDTNGGGYTGL
jgi:hypothetical protein